MLNIALRIAVLVVVLWPSASGGRNGKADRRIPYYNPDPHSCDYILEPNDRCGQEIPDATGCCPIGFECAQQGRSEVFVCREAPPAYELSAGCDAPQRASAHGKCSPDSCCPDGFDCVPNASGQLSTCEVTGAAIVTPPSYQIKPKQLPPGQLKQALVQQRRANKKNRNRKEPGATASTQQGPDTDRAVSIAATCPPCPASHPFGCSVTPPGGLKFQAPSCKCYDQPLNWDQTPPALTIASNGTWVLRETGAPASIKGLNWFGFNNGQTMLDGLWAGLGNATLGDFPTVLKRIKLLGFTGLRLPFTFAELDKAPAQRLYSASPASVDTIAQFRTAMTPLPSYAPVSSTPSQDLAAVYLSSTACPFDTNPTESTMGSLSYSNKHVPGNQDATTWNRFFWVVQYAVSQGFYVVIDQHFEQQDLQNSAVTFASEWARFWRDFVSLPGYNDKLSGRVFPELANEWDQFGCKWDGIVQPTRRKPGCLATYKDSMERAAAAITTESQRAGDSYPQVILVEGVGQQAYNFNWGDGFITHQATITGYGLADPRAFFKADTAATRGYRTVLAPHTYGRLVTNQALDLTYSQALWNRLHQSWGSKSPADNLTAASIEQQYAVTPTEFGSDCDPSTACDDNLYLRDYAAFINNSTGNASYSLNPVKSWFSGFSGLHRPGRI